MIILKKTIIFQKKTAKVISKTPHRKKIRNNLSKVAVLILTVSVLTTGVVFG